MFFIKDDKIYDTEYGYRKQYICTNTLWILSVLSFKYIVIIDRQINATLHGIRRIYGINGSDKS